MTALRIETSRFFLRPLEPADATERYASWFLDAEVKRYIAGAQVTPTVGDLRRYIEARAGKADVLFLGVFTKDGGTHIGNIKFEPVDRAASRAVLGIMIGDASWRGRGAALEVIVDVNAWLAKNWGIREIVLGVERAHAAAVRAYEKAGFVITGEVETHLGPGKVVSMAWRQARPDAER